MLNRIKRITGALQYLGLRFLVFLSHVLKSFWLFFPSIIFIFLAIWCFWMLGQGKDLIIAFSENHEAKAFFLVAIGFWIYVTWFSSRIIATLKLRKQQEHLLKLIRNHPSTQSDKKIENVTYF